MKFGNGKVISSHIFWITYLRWYGSVDDDKLIKFHKRQWDQLSIDILSQYRHTTDSLLGDIELPEDIVNCSAVNCDNHIHINHLSEVYVLIMHCLSDADKVCIQERQKCPVSPMPGRNDYLAQPYNESREAYFLWCNYNKPRSGVVHELMKRSRARFKYAQNQVLKNEKTLRADALASKLASGDVKCLWRKIKKCNSGNVAFSNKIENETVSQNITNMWRDHYQQLFNSVNDTNDKP